MCVSKKHQTCTDVSSIYNYYMHIKYILHLLYLVVIKSLLCVCC